MPCSIPSTLMSSSRSGQRIPSPRPRIWKFSRCFADASERRQDQLSGTLIVRPSLSWAMITSSETETVRIAGSELIAMLIPGLHYRRERCTSRVENPSFRAKVIGSSQNLHKQSSRCTWTWLGVQLPSHSRGAWHRGESFGLGGCVGQARCQAPIAVSNRVFWLLVAYTGG